jgi:hypothetical protein
VRVLILLVACAGPFKATGASQASGVEVRFCGSSGSLGGLRKMEPPSDLPSEVGGSGGLEPPQEVRLCLELENHGPDTARLDRSYLQLKCPSEKQPWVPDSDDQEVIAHAGESRKLHVGFHYSPLPSGEDVKLLFDNALTVGGRRAKLPPLPLRRN